MTLTANAILTVSNSGMFGDADVTVDSAGTLNVGTASSTAVVIGKTGTPVTIPGNVAINGTLTLGSASTTGQLIFRIASSSFTTLLQASSSQASNLTFTLPTTAGTAGQAMLTDGAGNLFFGNISSSQWLNGTSGTISYSSGSIGINTTTPLALLSVVGSATSTALLFDIASSTGASLFRVSPNGTVTIGPTVLNPTGGVVTLNSVRVQALPVPPSPTVAVIGTVGSTLWQYTYVARLPDGTSPTPPASGFTHTGNATLSATNFNRITIPAVAGVVAYDVCRSYTAGTPSNIGKIGTITAAGTFDDTGLAADVTSCSNLTNQTGIATFPSVLIGTNAATNVLVCDGDSLTVGQSGTHSYCTAIAPSESFTVYVTAFSGRTLDTMIWAAPGTGDQLYSYNARRNIVLIWGGRNNFASGGLQSIANTFSRLVAYAGGRRKAGFKVGVVTMVSSAGIGTGGATMDSLKNTYNALIRLHWHEFADFLVDAGADANIGVDGAYLNGTYFAGDGVHMFDAGYAIVTALAQIQINNLINGPVWTVATLPTCNSGSLDLAQVVTDALAPAYNTTIAGGGTVRTPVVCDGANWVGH